MPCCFVVMTINLLIKHKNVLFESCFPCVLFLKKPLSETFSGYISMWNLHCEIAMNWQIYKGECYRDSSNYKKVFDWNSDDKWLAIAFCCRSLQKSLNCEQLEEQHTRTLILSLTFLPQLELTIFSLVWVVLQRSAHSFHIVS